MTSNEYQQRAISFRMNECDNMAYPTLGLLEESAEYIGKCKIVYQSTWEGFQCFVLLGIFRAIGWLCGRIAKRLRRGECRVPFRQKLQGWRDVREIEKELGDIHWMVVNIDDQFGLKTEDVNLANVYKLDHRLKTDTIINHKDH